MNKIFSSTADEVKLVIKECVPRRETGGAIQCGEMVILSLFNLFTMTMNIMTRCYNYSIVHHPIFLLFAYVFSYSLLTFCIYKLTTMLQSGQNTDGGLPGSKSTKPGEPTSAKVRRNTQTRKTTLHRYQKGRYHYLPQGVTRPCIRVFEL